MVTSRAPQPRELDVMMADLELYQKDFKKDPKAAKQLLTIGEKRNDPNLDVAELAAYTLIANTFLNLDEAITTN